MTNTLIVDNFLIFKHIEIDIKRYNVFIGPQASGKSVVAKILYLFYHFPNTCFSLINKTKREIKNEMVSTFKQIFPENVWKKQQFRIELKTDKGVLAYRHDANKRLVFYISEQYDVLLKALKKEYTKKFGSSTDNINLNILNIYNTLKTALDNKDWGLITNAGSCCFIPADRSFFATLKEIVFTLMLNDVSIDYFIKQYGSEYEFLKRVNIGSSKYKNKQKELINGLYKMKDSKEYIHAERIDKSFDVEVSFASSGQQELLPILVKMFLSARSFNIIEEPESHIYPESQYSLMRFIVSRREPNDPETAFLFTTHSPYILTSINNLAYAGKLEEQFTASSQKEKLEILDKLYSKEERIPVGSLSAYMFTNGTVKSIIDKETNLINAEELDSISEKIASDFTSLVDLECDEV